MSSNNETLYSSSQESTLLDENLLNVIQTICQLCFSQVIGVLGIMANVVSILNFKMQRYKDGMNVTLTALALSDIGILLVQLADIHISNPWVDEQSTIIVKYNWLLLVIYANEYFVRVSGFITAFAAFERCLCVVSPIRAKRIITSKTSAAVNVFIFIFLSAYLILPYSFFYIDWKYLKNTNRTVLYVYTQSNSGNVYKVYYFISGMCLPYGTIIILTVFTTILVSRLRAHARWRKNNTSSSGSAPGAISVREKKAVAMLTSVSVLYIVCLIPHSALNVSLGVFPGMLLGGKYFPITMLTYAFVILIENVGASANIIVYYKMSSKYREVLARMFPIWKNYFA